MSIESGIVSEVESVAGTAVGAATGNPFSYLKIAGYAVGAVLAAYCVYRLVSYVEQAAADHAAVQVIGAQRDQAIIQANSNAAVAAQNEAAHAATEAAINAANAASQLRAEQLASDLKVLQNEKTPDCVLSPGTRTLLQRLR
jgi:hypothetical protein